MERKNYLEEANKEYDYKFYVRFKKFVLLWMKLFYRIQINGIENIPKDENYLLTANHLNILDSWLLIAATKHNLRFMVDQKLYYTKIGRWFFKKVGTFEVDPSGNDQRKNQEAIGTAIALLRSGEKVVIFPEGMTHPVDVYVPFKPGIPRIAKMCNTVLVPVGITGSYKPFHKLKVNIGTPINFKDLKLNKLEEEKYFEQKVRSLVPNKKK